MMSSNSTLPTMEEKNKMSRVTSMAPMKAAKRMAMKPVKENVSVTSEPPHSSMTRATPSPAPALMPKMSGAANGLRKAV